MIIAHKKQFVNTFLKQNGRVFAQNGRGNVNDYIVKNLTITLGYFIALVCESDSLNF